jgi:eukaryotic-like serine/threonine-protein kinase
VKIFVPWSARVIASGYEIAGKYRIVSLLGEGGMGVVYEALYTPIARRVAIKVIHPSMAHDPEALARFEREAQAVTRIGSQRVVDVLDFGNLENGDRFIVMEYLEGETLGARLKREGFLPQDAVVHIGIEVLEGLTRVHEAGIIHRDLKPGNIFLTARGVKILDFGVCKVTQTQGRGEALTTMGQLLGTPAYMAPETMHLGPSKIDARADLYSVGMILRRALSGRLPYEADTVVELLVRRREEKPLPLARVSPDVDVELAAIVDRAIAAEPAERFQSARELHRALVNWTHLRSDARQTQVDIDVDLERERLARGGALDDDEPTTLRLSGSPPKPK